jgi:hypothetical protein
VRAGPWGTVGGWSCSPPGGDELGVRMKNAELVVSKLPAKKGFESVGKPSQEREEMYDKQSMM